MYQLGNDRFWVDQCWVGSMMISCVCVCVCVRRPANLRMSKRAPGKFLFGLQDEKSSNPITNQQPNKSNMCGCPTLVRCSQLSFPQKIVGGECYFSQIMSTSLRCDSGPAWNSITRWASLIGRSSDNNWINFGKSRDSHFIPPPTLFDRDARNRI